MPVITVEKPIVEIDFLPSKKELSLENSFVYVHCHCQKQPEDFLVRIWRTTFLIDNATKAKSTLLHAEKISFAPEWTIIYKGSRYSFLLIFSGLPRQCDTFDLVEEIAQSNGFFYSNIRRNDTDVYNLNLL